MIEINVQVESQNQKIPNNTQLEKWCSIVLKKKQQYALCLRIVDKNESQNLNRKWRKKDYPTNVLSFPLDIPKGLFETNFLGDIIICAPIIEQEAFEQKKDIQAHWAHIIIHGCLHLLGYDHITDEDAQVMEELEVNLLKKLGFSNPYIPNN